jgi:uncharacterized repeat protein (TIGR01451 family)
MRKRTEAFALTALLAVALTSAAYAAGTPAGTAITNTVTVTYEDSGANPFSTNASVTTTVSQVAAVQTAPDNSSGAVAGQTVYYPHTVTNLGNGTDNFEITTSSSQSWTVTLYEDVNNNGAYDAGTDVLLDDDDLDTTPDTGNLAADDSLRVIVCVQVPGGASDGTVDVTTLTATSDFDGSNESATNTTTVATPSITVSKAVSPAGNQPPGTMLTYTIVVSNTGSGTASNVVLTDPIPANTTYVAGTITQDAAARTDIADGDNVDWNDTTANTVTMTIGTLAASASTTIEFQVTID